jgi:hypothetical protein
MQRTSFAQRFGLETSKPKYDDFPESAREALIHLLADLDNRRFIMPSTRIGDEIQRLTRGEYPKKNLIEYFFLTIWFWRHVYKAIRGMSWLHVFMLCERIYDRFLVYYDRFGEISDEVDLQTVRDYFSYELNNILMEENLAYEFQDGYFQRRGRAQTQKSIDRMGKVLPDPRLSTARKHHTKALQFFTQFPEPDVENCVKESLCVLEGALDNLTGNSVSNDFAKSLRKLSGNELGRVYFFI